MAASEVATEHIPVDDVFAAAFEERVLELKRLKEKACRGRYGKFMCVMSEVLAVQPSGNDHS